MPEQEPANLWTLSDLCTPWLIHVVATLRIADHIDAGIDQIGHIFSLFTVSILQSGEPLS
jgi:2,7-dihydroxy-5-methyl-1-naphthoate 7-O-methyltransferase